MLRILLPASASPARRLFSSSCPPSSSVGGGKSALVTGGATGIGEAICRRLAREGYAVTVADVKTAEGGALASDIGGDFVPLDVSVPESVEAAVAHVASLHGRLDALVNNAGVLAPEQKPLGEQSVDDWQRVRSINLDGTFYGLKYGLSQMARQQPEGGSIVNMGSINSFRAIPGMGAYTPCKFAVVGMTQLAAVEYATKGIRVNCVAPTTTKTAIVDHFISTFPNGPEEGEAFANSMNAIPGWVLPEDVASATSFLLGDEARMITGVTLPVDAGCLARMPVPNT